MPVHPSAPSIPSGPSVASLGRRDTRLILDFLAEVMAPCDLTGLAHRVVANLPALVPASITAWNEVDLIRNRMLVISNAPIPPALANGVAEEIFLRCEHPVVTYYQATGDGRAATISDFLSEDEFHATPIYKELYSLIDAEDQLSMVLPTPQPIVLGIAMNRPQRDFSLRDRAVLDAIRPHLAGAYLTALHIGSLRQAIDAVSGLSATLPAADTRGVALVDTDGRLDYVSDTGARLLRRWFTSSEDEIPAVLAEAEASGVIVRTLPDRQVVIQLAGGDSADGDPYLTTLVLSEQSIGGMGGDPDPGALARQLGVTDREAQVLHLVAAGESNGGIARQLKMSEATVRTHLRHAFAKLGVSNRTSAAARVHAARAERTSA